MNKFNQIQMARELPLAIEDECQPHVQASSRDQRDQSAMRIMPLPLKQETVATITLDGDSFSGEQYRIARTKIEKALPRPFILAVSSPCVGDGKTFTAVNLAATMANASAGRTLLIDADLRGAAVHRRFNIELEPGLFRVLTGEVTLEQAIVRLERVSPLHVLPAGKCAANPTDMFGSARWRTVAELVRQHFTEIVIDCPPIDLFADFELISSISNGVIVVVRPDHTSRTLCMAALKSIGPKLVGVLINQSEDWFLWRRLSRRDYSHYENQLRK